LPEIGTQDGKDPEDVPIIVKFFDPMGSWRWYAIEGEKEGDDYLFFGLVRGIETELRYFRLSDLTSITGRLPIERDLYFGKHTLAEVLKNPI
jgi:hypothetical protein